MTFDPLVPWPLIVGVGAAVAGLVVVRQRRGARTGPLVRTAVMAALALAAAAGPAVPGGRSEARAATADVLFVVDSTASMAAEDFAGSRPRLDGVREDITELAAAFPGAHFSLIRYAAQARVELPWTTDVAALETAIGVIRQERAVYSRGSRLAVPVATIDQQIPRSASGDDERHTVVFLFSDGEETAATGEAAPSLTEQAATLFGEGPAAGPPEAGSYAELAGSVDDGAVLGYGTAAGAPMREFVGRDGVADVIDDPYVRDPATGVRAISRLDEASLRRLAADLDLPYVHRAGPGGLGALAESIADGVPLGDAGARDAPRRLYWIPAAGLLAVVLWQAMHPGAEISSPRRAFGPGRRRRAA